MFFSIDGNIAVGSSYTWLVQRIVVCVVAPRLVQVCIRDFIARALVPISDDILSLPIRLCSSSDWRLPRESIAMINLPSRPFSLTAVRNLNKALRVCSIVIQGTYFTLLISSPIRSAPSGSTAFSVSKITGIRPSFWALARILRTNNVLPVIDSPPIIVTRPLGIPP